MIKYGEENQANEDDWYSALDFCCEYADTNDNGGRPGYWAEDIVMKAMPDAYQTNEYEGYWAEDIVREAMPEAYGEDSIPNEDEGYWAEDIVVAAMPSAYGEDGLKNKTYRASKNGGDEEGDGGYYAMDILSAQMPGLYADHGESGWFNLGIWQSL